MLNKKKISSENWVGYDRLAWIMSSAIAAHAGGWLLHRMIDSWLEGSKAACKLSEKSCGSISGKELCYLELSMLLLGCG
jgi:hypothetical protein